MRYFVTFSYDLVRLCNARSIDVSEGLSLEDARKFLRKFPSVWVKDDEMKKWEAAVSLLLPSLTQCGLHRFEDGERIPPDSQVLQILMRPSHELSSFHREREVMIGNWGVSFRLAKCRIPLVSTQADSPGKDRQ
jgi:hypothetical protein